MRFSLVPCLESNRLEILELVNLCFEKDMSLAVPVLYDTDQKSMKDHYAVIHDGHIVGLVCLNERKIVFDDDEIRMLGIGSVCVHPDYRGQGIMQFMMNEVNLMIGRGDYDLAYLSGKYGRYHHFGFEFSQACSYYDISCFDLVSERSFTFCEMSRGDISLIRSCLDLYHKQEMRVERRLRDFAFCCCQWGRVGYFVFCGDILEGYLIYYPATGCVEEIVLQDRDCFDGVLKGFMEWLHLISVCLKVPDFDYNKKALVGSRFSFHREDLTKYLFQIRDLERVISFFLSYLIKHKRLEMGRLVIDILHYGVIQIEVGADRVSVCQVNIDVQVDLMIDWWGMQGLLLNSYCLDHESDKVRRLCGSWFPIPVYLYISDFI